MLQHIVITLFQLMHQYCIVQKLITYIYSVSLIHYTVAELQCKYYIALYNAMHHCHRIILLIDYLITMSMLFRPTHMHSILVYA